MKVVRRLALASLVLALTGCPKGGAEGGARSAEIRTDRSPLAALSARAPFAVRVSMRRLRGTALGDALPSLVRDSGLAERYGQWVRACNGPPIDAFHEIVVGGTGEQFVFAAELLIPPDQAMACVKGTFGGREVQFQERPALRIDATEPKADKTAPDGKNAKVASPTGRPLFALVAGSILIVADETSLAEALDLNGGSGPLAGCLELGDGAFLAACGTPPGVAKEARILGRTTSGELSVEGTLTFDDASGPTMLSERIAAAKKGAFEENKFVRDALESIRVDVEGAAAKVRIGVSGDGVAQAAYLVALSSGARRALWEQEAKALAEEARVNVAALAESLRKNAPEKPRPRGPVFPVAPPPVPAKVPRAAAYSPTAEDFAHPTWAALGFSIKEPIRYQYELGISPDRRRAVVRARGDLDGNGRTSLFEVTLEVKRGVVVSSAMKVLEETE